MFTKKIGHYSAYKGYAIQPVKDAMSEENIDSFRPANKLVNVECVPIIGQSALFNTEQSADPLRRSKSA